MLVRDDWHGDTINYMYIYVRSDSTVRSAALSKLMLILK